MEFTGTRLYERLSHKWWPTLVEVDRLVRRIHDEAEYTASVYEYIEEGENEKDVVENSLDFFRVAGFSHPPPISRARNWQSSVLLDMSDLIYTGGGGGYGWTYWGLTAAMVLRDRSRRGTVEASPAELDSTSSPGNISGE